MAYVLVQIEEKFKNCDYPPQSQISECLILLIFALILALQCK